MFRPARSMSGISFGPYYPSSKASVVSTRVEGISVEYLWYQVLPRMLHAGTIHRASVDVPRRSWPCPLLIVVSSTGSMLYGAGPSTGGRIHGGGGRHMDSEDWDGLTVCTRDGTCCGSSRWRATMSSCMRPSDLPRARRRHCATRPACRTGDAATAVALRQGAAAVTGADNDEERPP
jgi:hypothetical protein